MSIKRDILPPRFGDHRESPNGKRYTKPQPRGRATHSKTLKELARDVYIDIITEEARNKETIEKHIHESIPEIYNR